MTFRPLALLAPVILAASLTSDIRAQDQQAPADDTWLPTLITATPQEGFELAVTLARRGVATTQPDRTVLRGLRPEYAYDPDSLIVASHVIAVHFQTIAAANNYWRSE